jgi:hypothetical protein
MENLPTAEEILQKHVPNRYTKENSWKNAMIEFAKLHVEQALKEASEKAKIKYEYSGNTGSEYCYEYVDQNSILNSYPLTNIK